jgi:hypothetical protein
MFETTVGSKQPRFYLSTVQVSIEEIDRLSDRARKPTKLSVLNYLKNYS